MKRIIRLSIFIFSIITFLSCNTDQKPIQLEQDVETPFFVKDQRGYVIESIDAEFIKPIYNHLIALKRVDDANSFLSTYDENGNINSTVNLPKNVFNNKINARAFGCSYHIQDFGTKFVVKDFINGQNTFQFGTTGRAKRLEAFTMSLIGVNLCYESHLAYIGWQGTKCNGEMTGTTGQSRQMEAVRISITDNKGVVFYKSHLADIGWERRWSFNGEVSGTTGQGRRLEAIQVKFFLF